MSDILDLHLEHFVKVKVKRIKNQVVQKGTPCESFTLDPLTINYSILRNLLARIFHIEGEFAVSFRKDNVYIPLTSDWDLDGAIHEVSKPYLSLGIELQPIDKTLDEWDIICPADIPLMEQEVYRCSEDRKSLAGSFLSQVETAICKVQRAFSFDSSSESLGKQLLMDQREFNNLMDRKGRIVNHRELHMAVYRAGVEPHIRPEVWPHLLNVYPHGMTYDERKIYMNAKCEEYYHLRHRWQHLMQAGTIPDVLYDITNMVRKDVRRTDRTEKFYSGSDDSGNVRTLFNILTTYAVNHPNVSYCQGMSDLLSPILYVTKKESVAYICFCGLMRRTHTNFRLDGRSMKLKFRHLQKMLRFYDQDLYLYLKDQDALDLLFCYRWLLLELKREFPYNEMLNMMEVVWASLPPKPPHKELDLYDVKFPTAAICNSLKDRTRTEDYLDLNEHHFGVSARHSFSQSLLSNTMAKQVKKWELRVRRESRAREDTTEVSSEAEIRLPVHYRQRKYRSYITGKLGRLNNNENCVHVATSCKIPDRKNSFIRGICQSWSCGEKFEEKKEVTDALYEAREFLRNQWCYSNTINEIQLNNWLNNKNYEKLETMECGIGGKDSDVIGLDKDCDLMAKAEENELMIYGEDSDLKIKVSDTIVDHEDNDLMVSREDSDITCDEKSSNSIVNGKNNRVTNGQNSDLIFDVKNSDLIINGKDCDLIVDGKDCNLIVNGKNCDLIVNGKDSDSIVNGKISDLIVNIKESDYIINEVKSSLKVKFSEFMVSGEDIDLMVNIKDIDSIVNSKDSILIVNYQENHLIPSDQNSELTVRSMGSDSIVNGKIANSTDCNKDTVISGVASCSDSETPVNEMATDTLTNDGDSDTIAKSRQRHGSNDSSYSTISDDLSDDEENASPKSSPSLMRRSQSEGYLSDSETNETTPAEDEDYDSEDFDDVYSDDDDEFLDSMAGQQYEEVQTYFDRKKDMLPPPHVLGDGNPFLLFLCIAMIQCHRDEILKRQFDFNELGIYFDRFVRKHKLSNVLSKAQKMFKEYLNMGWDVEDKGDMSDDPDT